jgi:hypothetical protein
VEGPTGQGGAVEQEEPPVDLQEVEEGGANETPQELPKETPQELEGCEEEPPGELQEVEEGGPKETPQEPEGCAWETLHGDRMAERETPQE